MRQTDKQQKPYLVASTNYKANRPPVCRKNLYCQLDNGYEQFWVYVRSRRSDKSFGYIYTGRIVNRIEKGGVAYREGSTIEFKEKHIGRVYEKC